MKHLRVPLGDPTMHFYITRGVARAMGISLSEAMHSGQLKPEGYAAMVTACRGCALLEACQQWLGQQATISPTPPPGCYNGEALSRLKAAH